MTEVCAKADDLNRDRFHNPANNYQPGPDPSASLSVHRDPEDRRINEHDEKAVREKTLDKTIADSFPTSDPPSSIPDPSEDDSVAA